MWFWIITLAIMLCVSLWVNYNLLRKVEVYEDFCTILLSEAHVVLQGIRDVDLRGAFEADDEVGDAFDGIKSLIKRLETFLELEEKN